MTQESALKRFRKWSQKLCSTCVEGHCCFRKVVGWRFHYDAGMLKGTHHNIWFAPFLGYVCCAWPTLIARCIKELAKMSWDYDYTQSRNCLTIAQAREPSRNPINCCIVFTAVYMHFRIKLTHKYYWWSLTKEPEMHLNVVYSTPDKSF